MWHSLQADIPILHPFQICPSTLLVNFERLLNALQRQVEDIVSACSAYGVYEQTSYDKELLFIFFTHHFFLITLLTLLTQVLKKITCRQHFQYGVSTLFQR